MTSINKTLNDYLQGKRIAKDNYDDLKIVIEEIGYNKLVLDWFHYLQSIETVGWRPKLVTQKLARILANASKGTPVEFYALFCPSYKKGEGVHGFRTDDVGNTSLWGIETLRGIFSSTKKLGIPCKAPKAIFFNIAVEQPEKTLGEIKDLETNIVNLRKHIPEEMKFELLSEALVGNTIRYEMPNSIMVYTPTMLERARVYSGMKFESDPLPIIFLKHPGP